MKAVIAGAAGSLLALALGAGALADTGDVLSGSSAPTLGVDTCHRVIGTGVAHLSLLGDVVPADAGTQVCVLVQRLQGVGSSPG